MKIKSVISGVILFAAIAETKNMVERANELQERIQKQVESSEPGKEIETEINQSKSIF